MDRRPLPRSGGGGRGEGRCAAAPYKRRRVERNLHLSRADPSLCFGQPSPLRCVLLSLQGLTILQGPQVKIGADCVISSSRTALHVGALFLRNRHPSNASSLRLSPRGLTTLRGPRSSIRQYAGVLFLVIIRFSLAEKSCGVFAREKWRQRKRGAAGRLAPVNAMRNVGRYLCTQKPYVLLFSEGIFT